MTHAKYGYDAPGIIKNLLLLGFPLFCAGLLSLQFDNVVPVWLVYTFFSLSIPLGLSFLIPGVLMVWSSKIGKRRVVDAMITDLGMKGDETILDVGCGRGLLAITAAKKLRTGKVIGIDIWRQEDQSNNNMRETYQNAEAEEVRDRLEIITNDMTQMQFAEHSFDMIISCLAIHNIEAVEGRKKAINEIARVVKPGGRISLLDFQFTEQYAAWLADLGWKHVVVTKRDWRMFPPVRIVNAVKPA